MSERAAPLEWIDADAFLRWLKTKGLCREFESTMLNFREAERLADVFFFPFEFQSDGCTLIRVGLAMARIVRIREKIAETAR